MTRQCEAFETRAANFSGVSTRALAVEDGAILGDLLYAAYKGTIDDEGQSQEEARSEGIETLQGRYGPVIWPACFIATEITAPSTAVCCCVVTDSEKFGPLIAFAATHPDFQKRGLAGALIALSVKALQDVDVATVSLVVTDDNEPAVSLYQKLGFVAI